MLLEKLLFEETVLLPPPVHVNGIVPVIEAPSVTVQMASNDSSKPIQVSISPEEVGQDVLDRSIAQVVRGV